MSLRKNLNFRIIIIYFLVVSICGLFISFSTCIVRHRSFANNYGEKVAEYCAKYNLEVETVFALIFTESSFCEDVVSSKGAIGLMQLMPETAAFIAKKINYALDIDLFDADVNLNLGCAYLAYLKNGFVNEKTVLCAYNAGEGRVRQWLSDKRYSKDSKAIDVIPYNETSKYVKKIFFYKKIYKRILKMG